MNKISDESSGLNLSFD